MSTIQTDNKITALALEFFCKDATQKHTPNQSKMYNIEIPTKEKKILPKGIFRKNTDNNRMKNNTEMTPINLIKKSCNTYKNRFLL